VYITPALLISRSIGRRADAVQRREVEFLQCDHGVGILRGDAVFRFVALVEIAHRQHDLCALVG
jgi:hypothetical protein